MSSIFVQLPSYHDFELPKTIINALKQSSGLHRINFGVHHSFYEKDDIYIPKIDNVRKIVVKAPENIGLGLARNLTNGLYGGEDYYLQIDSHTRFDKGWDAVLISDVEKFKACGVQKPLLSTYPGVYRYDAELNEIYEPVPPNFISFKENPAKFAETLIPSQLAVPLSEGDKTTTQSSISGGYIFSTGEFHTVGYNDKVAFWGEEILIAASAWTRGFDLLIPSRTMLYHLYYDHSAELQRNGRRHIWLDFQEQWQAMDVESKKEVIDILSTGRVGPQALGSERTLDDYGLYAGLDFRNRIVTQ